jgi:hypothetical protein
VEGIYDGSARDDCFLCALLEPERYDDGDCPRCHSRMRYHAAVNMDAPTLESSVQAAVARYQRDSGGDKWQRLVELLTLVHRFSPDSLAVLERDGPTLDELRTAWKELSG